MKRFWILTAGLLGTTGLAFSQTASQTPPIANSNAVWTNAPLLGASAECAVGPITVQGGKVEVKLNPLTVLSGSTVELSVSARDFDTQDGLQRQDRLFTRWFLDAEAKKWDSHFPNRPHADTKPTPCVTSGNAQSDTIRWTAPGVAGVYPVKVLIDDAWEGSKTGESGRDDPAREVTLNITVRDPEVTLEIVYAPHDRPSPSPKPLPKTAPIRPAISNRARKPQEPQRLFSLRSDLDGDGKPENITLHIYNELDGQRWGYSLNFRLEVNGKSLWDKSLNGSIDGLYLADINSHDRFREISVHNVAPNDSRAENLFRFDRGRLLRVGNLEDPTFLGNSVVKSRLWFGAYAIYQIYRLNPQGQLRVVPRRFYEVEYFNAETSKKNDWLSLYGALILHPRRQDGIVLQVLPEKTLVKIVSTDFHGWFLVRSKTGIRGWVREKQMRSLMPLAVAG